MTRYLAVVIAAAIAGCSQADSNSFKASFDKSFNASFDKSTHDSCVQAATAKGGAADAVERYCACMVAQLDKLSVDEKLKLSQTPDKLSAAAQACQPTSSGS